MIILRKLEEQQKNQRALKIKNRILKQMHDKKLAEISSPITKKLDTIKENIKEIGEIIENNIPQPDFGNTPTNQPIENNEGVLYDVELANTLKNLSNNNGFFKSHEDREHGWLLKKHPIKKLGGTDI